MSLVGEVGEMTRYVLRYQGPGRAPVGDVAHIERSLRVLDRAPDMLLVEATGSGVHRIRDRTAALTGTD